MPANRTGELRGQLLERATTMLRKCIVLRIATVLSLTAAFAAVTLLISPRPASEAAS